MNLKPGTLCYFIDCGPLDGHTTTVMAGPDPCPFCKIDTYGVTKPTAISSGTIFRIVLRLFGDHIWVHRHQLIPINTPDVDVTTRTDEEITA